MKGREKQNSTEKHRIKLTKEDVQAKKNMIKLALIISSGKKI